MPEQRFVLSAPAPVDPDFAFHFLADLTNHRHLHPLFVRADLLVSGVDSAGRRFQEFAVTERPRLAGLRYAVRFAVRLTVSGQREYTADVRAPLGTRLVSVVRCEGGPAATTITETTTVRAPWPTFPYVARQALGAHRASFRLMPAVLLERRRALPPTHNVR